MAPENSHLNESRYAFDFDDPLVAELYDRCETGTGDVEFITGLLDNGRSLRILECFCGTGRILVPLAERGHEVVGIDIAGEMVRRIPDRVAKLSLAVGIRLQTIVSDVFETPWGGPYDAVILASNCLYELSTGSQQARCIELAANALKPGGVLIVDNDNYRGGWEDSDPQKEHLVFQATTDDGATVQVTRRDLSFDTRSQLLTMRRTVKLVSPNGPAILSDSVGQKRPVRGEEVLQWLAQYGFEVRRAFGDYSGSPFQPDSRRATFVAEKVPE